MKVIVCGGRNFDDRAMLFRVLDSLHEQHRFTLIIHGMARGADRLADNWAQYNQVRSYRFHAAWDREKRGAGPLRNARMLDKGQPELVIGFPGGRGTRDMMRKALDANVKVLKVKADGTVIEWRNDFGGSRSDGDHPPQADTL